MDFQTFVLLIIIVAITIFATAYFVKKKPGFFEIVDKLQEECYKLFLTAEKHDWINEEKMAWCVKQLLILLPDFGLEIDEATVKLIAQYVYDMYKLSAKKYLGNEEIEKELTE